MIKIPRSIDDLNPEDRKRGKYKKKTVIPADLMNELSQTQLLMIRDLVVKEYEKNQLDSYRKLFDAINSFLDKLMLGE